MKPINLLISWVSTVPQCCHFNSSVPQQCFRLSQPLCCCCFWFEEIKSALRQNTNFLNQCKCCDSRNQLQKHSEVLFEQRTKMFFSFAATLLFVSLTIPGSTMGSSLQERKTQQAEYSILSIPFPLLSLKMLSCKKLPIVLNGHGHDEKNRQELNLG